MPLVDQIQRFFHTYITFNNVENFLEGYRGMGGFFGVLLPMLEAFFPVLPLVVFVLANAAAYGFYMGFLLSWMGTCLGSIIVFTFCRLIVRKHARRWIDRRKKMKGMLKWLEKGGFGPVFILLSIPFTPSSLINVLCGLSNMNVRQFYFAVLLGKMIMIGIVTFIGTDWRAILSHPARLILVVSLIIVLWFAGKIAEKKMTQRQVMEEGD